MTVLVTGGAGFIGSALVRHLVSAGQKVVNIDKLTYAGDLRTLESVAKDPSYMFAKVDVCDADAVAAVFKEHQPTRVFHLAAETHVDRSIDGPLAFAQTNVMGTVTLLQAATTFWEGLGSDEQKAFRFLNVSTDEVYGELGETGLFRETTPYAPNSPYSASKASADHFTQAWNRTYGLPTLITNCSNNYGPFQNKEKLIPTVVLSALSGSDIPIYGAGENVRDWLYVDDHVRGLELVAQSGAVGETFNIGGSNELTNIKLVRKICDLLDRLSPRGDGKSYAEQIRFVTDRPGHDARYAIDAEKIKTGLKWAPLDDLATGLEKTIAWYLSNLWWLGELRAPERLGAGVGSNAGQSV